jgi:hypothetical protein
MMFAADAGSAIPWAAGGSATLLLTVAIALIFRNIAMLLRENRRCNRRLGILFRIVVKNKLEIPDLYWDDVQDASTEPLPLENKRGEV